MACVFVEIGQEVHVAGNLEEAIHEGVRQGYHDGCRLRCSVVGDPCAGSTPRTTPRP